MRILPYFSIVNQVISMIYYNIKPDFTDAGGNEQSDISL